MDTLLVNLVELLRATADSLHELVQELEDASEVKEDHIDWLGVDLDNLRKLETELSTHVDWDA